MSVIKMYTYSLASKGHKELKRELKNRGHNIVSLKKSCSLYKYKRGHFIINWGYHKPWRQGIIPDTHFLNPTGAVSLASNKLSTFQKISEEGHSCIPLFTTDKEEAEEFFEETDKVYCREKLDSSQGRGIVVATSPSSLVNAPLYTSGIDCQREFRVHVMRGEVIDFVMKKRMSSERREEEGITLNEDIRSHDNGYVFARQDVQLPDSVKEAALVSIVALGLDFGAVDVVLNPYDSAFVLEINTAPGIVETSVRKYADAIERWISDVQ